MAIDAPIDARVEGFRIAYLAGAAVMGLAFVLTLWRGKIPRPIDERTSDPQSDRAQGA